MALVTQIQSVSLTLLSVLGSRPSLPRQLMDCDALLNYTLLVSPLPVSCTLNFRRHQPKLVVFSMSTVTELKVAVISPMMTSDRDFIRRICSCLG